MSDKKSYTEVVASFETHIIYIREDIGEIKEQLKVLNARTGDCEVQVAKNKTRIGLIYKIGGSILGVAAILATLAFGVLNLFD